MSLLCVRDLTVDFPSAGLRALDGVDLDLDRGEALALVGESGCGKSTVALAVLGLLPPQAKVAGGTVQFAGEDILRLSEPARNALRGRRIALVFQDPLSALTPWVRAGEQVGEVLRRHRALDRRAAARRSLELFAEMGIPEPERAVRAWPHELSGGQRQRVLIAAALAGEPDLLLADEPTTALDVTVQAQVLGVIDAARQRRGLALLLVTHNLAVAAGMCQRIAVMYAGRIVEEVPSERLLSDARHPYTRGLLAALPRLDQDAAMPAIPGQPPRLPGAWVGCAFAERCAHADAGCQAPAVWHAVAAGHRHRCLKSAP